MSEIVLIEKLIALGPLGIVVLFCGALFRYLLLKDASHKEERTEWGKLLDTRQAELVDVIKENNKALQDLTIAVEKIK